MRTTIPNQANARPVGPAYAIVTACCCLLILAIGLAAEHRNYDLLHGFQYQEQFHHHNDADQYARLADALIEGRFDLDLPVPDELLALDDPYDYDARYAIGSQTCRSSGTADSMTGGTTLTSASSPP